MITFFHAQKNIKSTGKQVNLKQNISDFTSSVLGNVEADLTSKSWSNGSNFHKLLKNLEPDLQINFDENKSPEENLAEIFEVAEELGFPPLLDPELVASEPDEKSMMTYLAYFKDYSEPAPSKCSLNELSPYHYLSKYILSFNYFDYLSRISIVLNFISTKVEKNCVGEVSVETTQNSIKSTIAIKKLSARLFDVTVHPEEPGLVELEVKLNNECIPRDKQPKATVVKALKANPFDIVVDAPS